MRSQASERQVESQLKNLLEWGTVTGWTDAQLLDLFSKGERRSAESAFAAIVSRHGPMVLGVCRDCVGDPHLADDAFQAVFLVLARRAGEIRDPRLLGNWLYGVALRASRKALAREARRRRFEARTEDGAWSGDRLEGATAWDRETPEKAVGRAEEQRLLHQELARLSADFRRPVILCYFEGLTHDEAATRLGCPVGTVRSRLARARDRLRTRLMHQGVDGSVAAMATRLEGRRVLAMIPDAVQSQLARSAVKLIPSRAIRAILPGTAGTIADAVVREIRASSVRFAATILLGGAALVMGGLCLMVSRGAGTPGNEPITVPAPLTASLPRAQPVTQPRQEPKPPESMTFTGFVRDLQGRPIKDAEVTVVARPKVSLRIGRLDEPSFQRIGQRKTEADGRFQVQTERTSSKRTYQLGILVGSPGFGTDWTWIDPDEDQPALVFRLEPEHLLRGKISGPDGQPISNAKVQVAHMRPVAKDVDYSMDSPNFWTLPAGPMGASWPSLTTTDTDGRFVLKGLRGGLEVNVKLDDSRWPVVGEKGVTDGVSEMAFQVPAGTVLTGRIVHDDTNQPASNAIVNISAGSNPLGSFSVSHHQADIEGRFRVLTLGRYFQVTGYPAAAGSSHLAATREFDATKGETKDPLEIRLPRGVLLTGRVRDDAGQSIEGASVTFYSVNLKRTGLESLSGWQTNQISGSNGQFGIVVPPGKGRLLVMGPSSEYTLQTIGDKELVSDRPGGDHVYAHAIHTYDIQADALLPEIPITLRRGNTLTARVIGPNGQSIDRAEVITILSDFPIRDTWSGAITIPVRNGLFTLSGLDPSQTVWVDILLDGGWGKHLEIKGDVATGKTPLEVRLEPCGAAKLRMVDPDGKPIAEVYPWVELLASPGPTRFAGSTELAADAAYLPNIDRLHAGKTFTDADGRLILEHLIPGAHYRITERDSEKGTETSKDFAVRSGETIDLGEIVRRPTPKSEPSLD